MSKLKEKKANPDLDCYKNSDFRIFAAMFCPDVPVRDTSVKSLIETSQPVLPLDEQYYDNDTPIHIYKSFDFKNMPMDPSAFNHARNYQAPIPEPTAPLAAQQTNVQVDVTQ